MVVVWGGGISISQYREGSVGVYAIMLIKSSHTHTHTNTVNIYDVLT